MPQRELRGTDAFYTLIGTKERAGAINGGAKRSKRNRPELHKEKRRQPRVGVALNRPSQSDTFKIRIGTNPKAFDLLHFAGHFKLFGGVGGQGHFQHSFRRP